MTRRSLICFIFLVLVSGLFRGQTPAGWAVVTGQVLDARGAPVPGATISLMPAAAFSGGLPYAATDQEGRYRIASPPFGKAWLCAVKASAGYPNTNFSLFAPEVDDRPVIFLTANGVLTQDIHLAAPDGILEAKVVDGVTNEIVSNGHITMRRQKPAANYSESIPKDGRFLYALPAVAIEIIVTAPGYRQWRYTDKDAGSALLLGTSEHRRLTIKLVPEKASDQPSQN